MQSQLQYLARDMKSWARISRQKNQHEQQPENKVEHKSQMWERRSMPQYVAVTKQLRLENIYTIAEMQMQSQFHYLSHATKSWARNLHQRISMNQSESKTKHKSLICERRSMPQYIAVTIKLRVENIYIIADMQIRQMGT